MSHWHWPVALVAAASLHLAVAAVAPSGASLQPGAKAEGEGGFEIGLGYLGGFADRVETAPPEQTQEHPQEAPAAPVEAPPEPELLAQPAPAAEPEPQITPEPAPIPAQVAVAPPAPRPAPKPKVAAPKPAPSPEPAPVSAPSQTAKAVGPTQTAMAAGTGRGRERSAGGKPGGARTYFSELKAALNRHKTYPPELKKRKTQGTVMVAFAIDTAGDLLRAQVTKSSGHPELDAAALAMLHSASPLPPLPPELKRSELSVELPVEYSLITD